MKRTSHRAEAGRAKLRTHCLPAAICVMALVASSCRDRHAGEAAVESYRRAGKAVEASVASIQQALSKPRMQLQLRTAPSVVATSNVLAPGQAFKEPSLPFRIGGIVGNNSNQLVLTSVGVAGKGEELEGFMVVNVTDDSVTLADGSGKERTIRLYEPEKRKEENEGSGEK